MIGSVKQVMDAQRDPEDYGKGENLYQEDLFSDMTEEEGLEQRTQTQEIDSGGEAITDVPEDHELFEDYMEINDTQRETIRTRGGRVIKRPTLMDDYGI